ncbi:MAG: hypothetical protein Q7S22_07255 [Candidatus Micrarchaeota archaeon]|nr:hypothetical protein [Candidatus Micrarchaeota archaeon]
MQLLYIYDLKSKNKKEFNRLKRVFYYHLHHFDKSKLVFRTKSVLIVQEKHELLFDDFFKRFKGNIEVYKVRAESIEEL